MEETERYIYRVNMFIFIIIYIIIFIYYYYYYLFIYLFRYIYLIPFKYKFIKANEIESFSLQRKHTAPSLSYIALNVHPEVDFT